MPDLRFTEIEHKYVVDAQFDLQRFREVLVSLSPPRTGAICVRDRYYLTAGGQAGGFLIRHRFDPELHHLTLKAVGSDTEARSGSLRRYRQEAHTQQSTRTTN